MEFPIGVLCGAEGEGGTSDCKDFVEVNPFFAEGKSQFFQVPDTDETLGGNIDKVTEIMIGFFDGSLTGCNEPKDNPNAQ